jgi:uncharacterized protein YgbK (DUF1537 family)
MLKYTDTINALPPEYREPLTEKNRKAFLESGLSIIVLDDDPTGTQTIYDVPVLTTWGKTEIETLLNDNIPLFFILTNSRSLPAGKANLLALTIGQNIKMASEATGKRTLVISRGDSTLRGHYPNEVDALGEGLGISAAPHILIPAFFQGRRFTIADVHYVGDGEYLTPAGETPFARDSSFGYHASDLKDYVEEKTCGRIKSADVASISINDLRINGPDKVAATLLKLLPRQVCIVNAAAQSDLDVFSAGFYKALHQQLQPVLLRTAASVIPSLAGVKVKPLLQKHQLVAAGKGGLVVIGSYVPMTNGQLEHLKKNLPVTYIEIQAKELLNREGFINETKRVSEIANRTLKDDGVAVIYTSRVIIQGNTPDESLQIINRISAGLVETVKGITIRPKFFIAKGGITSSDILTKSLEVKKAQVMGQIIPGVPVWQLNDCRAFPGLIYMPFPGNLGGDDALYNAVQKLI